MSSRGTLWVRRTSALAITVVALAAARRTGAQEGGQQEGEQSAAVHQPADGGAAPADDAAPPAAHGGRPRAMSVGLSDADIKTVAALHAGDLAAIDIATRVRAWAGDPAVKALAEEVRRTRVALDQALVNFAADKNVPLALIQSQGERREASLVVGAEADTAFDLTKGPPQERELVHSLEKKSMNDAGVARHALRTAATPGLRDLLNDFIDKLEDNQSAAALLLRRKP